MQRGLTISAQVIAKKFVGKTLVIETLFIKLITARVFLLYGTYVLTLFQVHVVNMSKSCKFCQKVQKVSYIPLNLAMQVRVHLNFAGLFMRKSFDCYGCLFKVARVY